MRTSRTAGIFLAVAAMTLISAAPATARSSSGRHRAHRDSVATQHLLWTINGMRARHHLHRYAWNKRLARCALAHSVSMANADSLFHNLPGDACVQFLYASENIGLATGSPSAAVMVVHDSMMAEGPCPSYCPSGSIEWERHGHYINLTSRVYRSIGIGVFTKNYGGQTLTWVTEDFVDP